MKKDMHSSMWNLKVIQFLYCSIDVKSHPWLLFLMHVSPWTIMNIILSPFLVSSPYIVHDKSWTMAMLENQYPIGEPLHWQTKNEYVINCVKVSLWTLKVYVQLFTLGYFWLKLSLNYHFWNGVTITAFHPLIETLLWSHAQWL